jgi:diguanylate cyclase (GGDEF)-like protein
MIGTAVLLLLCSLSLPAQRYTFQSYGRHEGLHNLDINCLLQDHTGILWVCTEFGLYRYDGSRFELVPTIEGSGLPLILGIEEDAAQRIWVSTPHALLYHDASGVHNIVSEGHKLDIDLRTSLAVVPNNPGVLLISQHTLLQTRMREDSNSWQILPVFSSNDVAQHPVLSMIRGVYVAPDGHLWLGCGDQLCEISSNSIRQWGKGQGVLPDHWRTMRMDRQHVLWARGEQHIARLLPNSDRFDAEDAGLPPSTLGLRSPCLVDDPQGRILTNITTGIARWEKGAWSVLTKANGIPADSIQAMLFDRQGSLWIDGGKSGLNRWVGYDEWESWTTDEGLSSNTVWAILRDHENKLWLGTELDLEQITGEAHGARARKSEGGLNMRQVQSIAQTADHHLWTGSDSGTAIDYDPRTGSSRVVASLRSIYQVFADASDRVWILSTNGLFYLDPAPGRRSLRQVPISVVPGGRFYRAVQEPSGALFLASEDGLFRFDGQRWSHVRMPTQFRPTYNTQIALEPDGSFWITGGSPPLLHARLDGEQITVLDQISTPTLASANIYLLATDRRGWLWVGTDSGVDVFDGHDWRRCTQEDGLIWNDTDTGAFYTDEDGSVWIGTSGGLSHILHPENLFVPEALEVSLSDVHLGTVALPLDGFQSVPWNRYPLTFRLSASNFARAHAITFRYRLEGVEENWSETSSHEVRYAQLPAGNYRLAVRAMDTGRNQQSPVRYLEFEIRPPWWRTSIFYALVMAGIAALLLMIWHWSNRLMIARQHQLKALVKERTRELEDKNAALVKARAALMEQATHDSLTGVLNRGAIFGVLKQEMERAMRQRGPLVAVLADIDHFKRINDTHGHQAGDAVLCEIAQRFRAAVRSYDSVGRYGGEEFMIVMPGLDRQDSIARIQQAHQTVGNRPVTYKNIEVLVMCSFGVAWLDQSHDLESLVHAADQALYSAKANGRNRMETAEPPGSLVPEA